MGVKVQKSALQTLFNFAKVWAAHQPHHTARKVFNSFQTLLNHIQGCVGCQMKGKTSIDMNLVVFCAKIQLELKNLQKCGKDPKIRLFFEVLRFFILSLNVVKS